MTFKGNNSGNKAQVIPNSCPLGTEVSKKLIYANQTKKKQCLTEFSLYIKCITVPNIITY